MKKLLLFAALMVFFCGCNNPVVEIDTDSPPVQESPKPVTPPKADPPPSLRDKVVLAGMKLVGQTEKTGNNDGEVVDTILATVGMAGQRQPYCAAFDRYCYDTAGLRNVGPRSAWSPDWVQNPTWIKAKGGETPLPGDAWGIYFASKKRVAHTGLVRTWSKDVVLTVEANTSPDATTGEADRNGDGIWSKRRLVAQIYSVRNWIGDRK